MSATGSSPTRSRPSRPRRPDELAQLSREYTHLSPIVEAITSLRAARDEADELQAMAEDAESEPEMRALAEDERAALMAELPAKEEALKILLLPADEADERNAILEIRAGTGGEEAALFGGDLLRMYQRYVETKGWRFELMSMSETGLGGVKEAVVSVGGRGAYARLKFESGVHRVQRVPETEAGGRIHTSAATVAVLPEAEDVDIALDEKDLAYRRLSFQRAGRAERQHHRQRRAHHPSAERDRGHPAGREVAAQEQGQGDEGVACPAL